MLKVHMQQNPRHDYSKKTVIVIAFGNLLIHTDYSFVL